jgi:phage-related minor tail protein
MGSFFLASIHSELRPWGSQQNHSSLQAAVLLSSRGTGVRFAMLLGMLSWWAGRPAGFVLSSRQVSNSSIKATTVEHLVSNLTSIAVAPYFGC